MIDQFLDRTTEARPTSPQMLRLTRCHLRQAGSIIRWAGRAIRGRRRRSTGDSHLWRQECDFQFYEDSVTLRLRKRSESHDPSPLGNSRNCCRSVIVRAHSPVCRPSITSTLSWSAGHGAGATEAPNADRSVTYEGHQMSIALSKPN